MPGAGPSPAKIMLIGEAPGKEEDLTGMPFMGRAGKLLDSALEEAGLHRSEIFITSTVKCRPPKNRKPKKGEIDACKPYLNVADRDSPSKGDLPYGKYSHFGSLGHTRGQIFARPDLAGYLSCHLPSRSSLKK